MSDPTFVYLGDESVCIFWELLSYFDKYKNTPVKYVVSDVEKRVEKSEGFHFSKCYQYSNLQNTSNL